MHIIHDWRPDLIIMMAGICDVTERDRITKYTTLRHNNIQDVVEAVMMTVKEAMTIIRKNSN